MESEVRLAKAWYCIPLCLSPISTVSNVVKIQDRQSVWHSQARPPWRSEADVEEDILLESPCDIVMAAQDKDASPHIAILRIQGPLCFANAARTKERILNLKVRPFLVCRCLRTGLLPTLWLD